MIQRFTLVAVMALALWSCKKQAAVDSTVENEGIQTETTASTTSKFEKNLVYDTGKGSVIQFNLQAEGEGSIQDLTIAPSGLSIVNDTVKMEVEGQISQAEVADLNGDGFPELLIFVQSAGSGSYGSIIGYSVNNGKSMSEIYLPETATHDKINKGYMGHDQFSISNNQLVQIFPIYREGDSNSQPSGGMRRVEYDLKDGSNSRIFEVARVVDSN